MNTALCHHLEVLSLETQVDHDFPFDHFYKLKSLTLRNYPLERNCSLLAVLSNLETLILDHCEGVSDFISLAVSSSSLKNVTVVLPTTVEEIPQIVKLQEKYKQNKTFSIMVS